MPLIEDIDWEEYPYFGTFYRWETDENAPLDEREAKEVEVLATKCDIQRMGSRRGGSFLGAGYTVYYPLERNPDSVDSTDVWMPIPIRRGMTFRGEGYTVPVVGEVEFVRFSQLGQCSVDINVKTESE